MTVPIQIGLPRLPEVGSEAHFNLLRKWLKTCNQNHGDLKCRPSYSQFLPTRLIDVGVVGSRTIRLYETQTSDKVNPDTFKYLALSHPWGMKPPYFCTFRKNLESHKKGILIADLTATFQDAVRTTRELGLQYLWIDSICIVQKDDSDDGDFQQEAQHMENVFSSAYCVLAASSAKSQSDGFLKKRGGSERDFVKFQRQQEAPFYVCRFIDDFNSQVMNGPLNRRGWVLQERVLAHRTIYFTDQQTYWECGEGVRCETLSKMEK
jgi:hypothetical protein